MLKVRYITVLRALLSFLVVIFIFPSKIYAAELNVQTDVINDNGGNWNPSDFTTFVKLRGSDITGSPTVGKAAPGETFTVNPGQYNVSVAPYEKYTSSYSGDCDSDGNVTLADQETKTCLITNNDSAPGIYVVTEVINDNGGIANTSDFTVHIKYSGAEVSGSPSPSSGIPGVYFSSLRPGTYLVSQDSNPSYTTSFSGDCDIVGSITLSLGNKTCIITNDDTVSPVPLLPEAGSTQKANQRICVSSNTLSWVLGIIFSSSTVFYLYKKNVFKKWF